MSLPSWEDWDRTISSDIHHTNNNHMKIDKATSNIQSLPAYPMQDYLNYEAPRFPYETELHNQFLDAKSNPKAFTSSKVYIQNHPNAIGHHRESNDIQSIQSDDNDLRKSAYDIRKANSHRGSSQQHINYDVNKHISKSASTYENMEMKDNSSSVSSSYNQQHHQQHQQYPQSQQQQQQYKNQYHINEFKYREICLSTSSKLKHVLDYLSKVKEYILKEGSIELEMVKSAASLFLNEKELNYSSSHQLQLHSRTSHPDHLDQHQPGCNIPKETIYLQNHSLDLQLETYLLLKAIVECFDSRTNIYLTQLKKIRDISNQATRNAVQNEKAESNTVIQRVRQLMEQQHHTEKTQLKNHNNELTDQIKSLQDKIEKLSKEYDTLKEMNQNHQLHQNNAVATAISQCKLEFTNEKEQLLKNWKLEQESIRNDAHRTIEEAKAQHNMHLKLEREHDSEVRGLLVRDKELLEHECTRLREELMTVNSKLITEKDIFLYRLKEEKDQAEQREQLALAESLKIQTQLKLEMKSIVAQYQANDSKRSKDLDLKMNKFREGLLAEHSIEIEKLNDRHRQDLQKFMAENQVRMQDQISKLKHTHELELNRLIRDNDRLQRIIIRHGGAEHFRSNNNSSSSNWNDLTTTESKQSEKSKGMVGELSKSPIYTSRVLTNLTPPSKFKSNNGIQPGEVDHNKTINNKQSTKTVGFTTDLEAPPPPPTIPVSNVLNWGALKDSLYLEEAQFSPKHLPPDPFELNEALATNASKASSKIIGYNSIDSSNKRVGNYMDKLENYLKGSTSSKMNDTVKEDGAIDSISLETLNNTSFPSSADISNASFNTQVAYKYLKTKEQLGLGTNFKQHDSDDDSSDESNLGGEDISMNISENSQKQVLSK